MVRESEERLPVERDLPECTECHGSLAYHARERTVQIVLTFHHSFANSRQDFATYIC